MNRPAAVDGVARGIDRTAEKFLSHPDHSGASFGAHDGAGAQQHRVAQHHHDRVPVAEPDCLGQMLLPAAVDDRADAADGHAQAADFDQPAIAGDHAAEAACCKIDRSAGDACKRFVDQVQHDLAVSIGPELRRSPDATGPDRLPRRRHRYRSAARRVRWPDRAPASAQDRPAGGPAHGRLGAGG